MDEEIIGWESVKHTEKLILEYKNSPHSTCGDGYSWDEWKTICKVFGVNPNTTHIIELMEPHVLHMFTDEKNTNEK